jgi:hypothetical protein
MYSLRQKRQLILWSFLAGIALIAMLIVTSRKDDGKGGTWVCRDSQWTAEGKPRSDKPKTPCY